MAMSPITIFSLALTFTGAIAILGALPNISRLLVYTFFNPDLLVGFGAPYEKQPIHWQDLSEDVGSDQQTPLNVVSRVEKDLPSRLNFI